MTKAPHERLFMVGVPLEEFTSWRWPALCAACTQPATQHVSFDGRPVILQWAESSASGWKRYSFNAYLPAHGIPYCPNHIEEARAKGEELVPKGGHRFLDQPFAAASAYPGIKGQNSPVVEALGVLFGFFGEIDKRGTLQGIRVVIGFSNRDFGAEFARGNLSRFHDLVREQAVGGRFALGPAFPLLLEELGEIADPRPAEWLVRFVRETAKEPWGFGVRWTYAPASLRAMGERAVPPLMEALSDSNADVRSFAAKTLGDLSDPAAMAALVESARHDPDASVREAAAAALGGGVHARTVEAREVLEALAADDPARKVRKRAAKILKR